MKICPYYKSSSNDELACMGFLVVERLIQSGKKIPFDAFHKKLDSATEKRLSIDMCTACPFYESDCDFREQKKGALPCGGFILLGHLMEEGVISIDDITENRSEYL